MGSSAGDLSDDTLRQIFSYLALKDVLHVYNVSKRWRGVIDSTPAIMRSVYLSLPNIDKTVAFRHRREELKQCKPFNWRPLCLEYQAVELGWEKNDCRTRWFPEAFEKPVEAPPTLAAAAGTVGVLRGTREADGVSEFDAHTFDKDSSFSGTFPSVSHCTRVLSVAGLGLVVARPDWAEWSPNEGGVTVELWATEEAMRSFVPRREAPSDRNTGLAYLWSYKSFDPLKEKVVSDVDIHTGKCDIFVITPYLNKVDIHHIATSKDSSSPSSTPTLQPMKTIHFPEAQTIENSKWHVTRKVTVDRDFIMLQSSSLQVYCRHNLMLVMSLPIDKEYIPWKGLQHPPCAAVVDISSRADAAFRTVTRLSGKAFTVSRTDKRNKRILVPLSDRPLRWAMNGDEGPVIVHNDLAINLGDGTFILIKNYSNLFHELVSMDPAEHSWKAAQASIIIGMEDSGVGENDNRFTALCGYGSRLAFADSRCRDKITILNTEDLVIPASNDSGNAFVPFMTINKVYGEHRTMALTHRGVYEREKWEVAANTVPGGVPPPPDSRVRSRFHWVVRTALFGPQTLL